MPDRPIAKWTMLCSGLISQPSRVLSVCLAKSANPVTKTQDAHQV